MLSDSERRSLDEIEQRLCREDPELARALASGRTNTWLYHVVTVIFSALGVLMLLIGPFGSAFLCFLVAVVSVLLHRFRWGIRSL